MGRELSDVFKAKTRDGKRKVLDKFDISKEDKNKFLNGIEDVGSEGSGGDSIKFEYYKIDWDKLNELGFDKNDNSIEGFSMQVKGILFSSHTAKIVVGGNAFGGINMSGLYASIGFIYYATAISFAFPIKALNADGTETIISSLKETSGDTNISDWLIPITEEEYYNIDGLMPV